MTTHELQSWLLSAGLEGASESEILGGLCERLQTEGFQICRAHVAQTALHPQFGGDGFVWRPADEKVISERYLRGPATGDWKVSPFYHMLKNGVVHFHQPLDDDSCQRFPVLSGFRDEGGTDYFASMIAFEATIIEDGIDPDAPPEGSIISLLTFKSGGFTAADIDTLLALMPSFGLALKSASARQMVTDIVSTYLGADAGRRVLSGSIQRGTVETINAVILTFDLEGFTHLSEVNDGDVIIAMLNDYFGVTVSGVEANGGNVLKFMGDGLLAIFPIGDGTGAHSGAVAAAMAIRRDLAELNRTRAAADLPSTGFRLALHAGDVMYGNIGAESRLDFTVIGAAVNTTARIQDMCRSLDRKVVLSSRVAAPLLADHDEIVSLGRYMLRGVRQPQELFTLYDPE